MLRSVPRVAALCIVASSLVALPSRALESACTDIADAPTHHLSAPLPQPVATLRPTVALYALDSATSASTVVLEGIILPARAGKLARTVYASVVSELAGRPVTLLASDEHPDRHGRLGGILRLEEGDSLAERLLAAGAGIADVSFAPCAERFLAAEAKARTEKRGIWGQSRIWTDLNAAATGLPDFVLGRGKVASVGRSGRTTYINFGDNFRTDATVRLREAVTSALVAAGLPPESLSGRMVEVRGWANRRNGLDLELDSPAALRPLTGASDTGTD